VFPGVPDLVPDLISTPPAAEGPATAAGDSVGGKANADRSDDGQDDDDDDNSDDKRDSERWNCGFLDIALQQLSRVGGVKIKKERIAVSGIPSHSYGTSLAIMGSHSVTCHPTQANAPRLHPSQ